MAKRISADKPAVLIRAALRPEFYQSVTDVLQAARSNAYRTVNFIMVEAYWNIGRMIVEEEQQGRGRAEYGRSLLKNLAARLTVDFGEPFSERNLRHFRQFYTCFPIRNALCSELEKYQDVASPSDSVSKIRSVLRSELTWSHYRKEKRDTPQLMTVS